MVETGATPKVNVLRRQISRIGRALTSPLLPDDYFALIRPTWSTRESTGTVIRVKPERGNATTIVIQPNFAWSAHQPGQYLRIGMEINGIRHWRAYSITSDPAHPGGVISITVKHTEGGRMSPVFNSQVQVGREVFLGEIEGEFMLPTTVPAKSLFLSAGSGITPIMSMLRELERRESLDDAIHVHSARTKDDMIFGSMMRKMADRREGYRLIEVHTADDPRFSPDDLDRHAPDWRERETFLSGPREMMDPIVDRFKDEGLEDRLHTERFQPVIGNGGGDGDGGTVHFRVSETEADCGAGVSVLVGGEEAGAKLPFGCRMGICHTCVGRLQDGAVRDLRTGAVTQASGQMVRTCINAPEGHIEIDL